MSRNLLLVLALPLLMATTARVNNDARSGAGNSGEPGTIIAAKIPKSVDTQALRGFELWTQDGATCRITANLLVLPGYQTGEPIADRPAAQAFGGCATASGVPGAAPPGVHNVNVPSGMFLTGVQVCLNSPGNSSNLTIRGLRVFKGRIDDTNHLVNVDGHEQWKINGCADWRPAAKCPAGSAVVGFRAHHSNNRYRALGPICAPIMSRNPQQNISGAQQTTIPAGGPASQSR